MLLASSVEDVQKVRSAKDLAGLAGFDHELRTAARRRRQTGGAVELPKGGCWFMQACTTSCSLDRVGFTVSCDQAHVACRCQEGATVLLIGGSETDHMQGCSWNHRCIRVANRSLCGPTLSVDAFMTFLQLLISSWPFEKCTGQTRAQTSEKHVLRVESVWLSEDVTEDPQRNRIVRPAGQQRTFTPSDVLAFCSLTGDFTFKGYESWQRPGLLPPPPEALKLLHR